MVWGCLFQLLQDVFDVAQRLVGAVLPHRSRHIGPKPRINLASLAAHIGVSGEVRYAPGVNDTHRQACKNR